MLKFAKREGSVRSLSCGRERNNDNNSRDDRLDKGRTPKTMELGGVKALKQGAATGESPRKASLYETNALQTQFQVFSQFGSRVNGKHITMYNLEKWFRQAKVIDGRNVTSAYVTILFKSLFKSARLITFEQAMRLIEELCRGKNLDPEEMQDKLRTCGPPWLYSPCPQRKYSLQ